ncbi:MAG: transposase family protein [Colwellia sp.]|nr:transposase family protein [Colwellia sp.]
MQNLINKEIIHRYEMVYYHNENNHLAVYVPLRLRNNLLCSIHIEAHFGGYKMFDRMCSQYWWPTMKRDAKLEAYKCDKCKVFNSKRQPVPPEQLEIKATFPMEKLCTDILKLQKSENGCRYLLTVIDVYTRYVWAKPVNEMNTNSITKFLEKIFSQFSPPTQLITDNGTQYTAKSMK